MKVLRDVDDSNDDDDRRQDTAGRRRSVRTVIAADRTELGGEVEEVESRGCSNRTPA